MKNNFYLVVLDGSEIDEIIHDPAKIINYVKTHERKTKRTKRSLPEDGERSGDSSDRD